MLLVSGVTGLRGGSFIKPSIVSGGSQAKDRAAMSSKPRSITKIKIADRGSGMGTMTIQDLGVSIDSFGKD